MLESTLLQLTKLIVIHVDKRASSYLVFVSNQNSSSRRSSATVQDSMMTDKKARREVSPTTKARRSGSGATFNAS